MKARVAISTILSLAVIIGCSGNRNKNFTEGRIEYAVSYDSLTLCRFNPRLLPSSLFIEFNSNSTKTTIEALSGAISFSIIKDYESQQYATLIKVVGKKLKHTEKFDSSHYPALYAGIPRITVVSEAQDCELYGYKCKRVSGYFSNPEDKFDIVYTNDIQIDSPNSNTPFESIDGVLIEFNLLLKPITMQLKATNITKDRIPESTFEVSKDYAEVDFRTMTDILSALQK